MDRDEPKREMSRYRLGRLSRRPVTYDTPEGPITIMAVVNAREAYVVVVSPKGTLKIQSQPEERS